MLGLEINKPDGGSFAVPVKTFVAPSLGSIGEYAHHNQIVRFQGLPTAPEIVVECDYDSDAFRHMLAWREQVFEGLSADYKRTGVLLFCSEGEEPLAERPVYGLWPSVLEPDASTLRMTVTLVCDLVGVDLSDNPITFKESVSEEQKAEIEQALTPAGLDTLKKYGVQLVGER